MKCADSSRTGPIHDPRYTQLLALTFALCATFGCTYSNPVVDAAAISSDSGEIAAEITEEQARTNALWLSVMKRFNVEVTNHGIAATAEADDTFARSASAVDLSATDYHWLRDMPPMDIEITAIADAGVEQDAADEIEHEDTTSAQASAVGDLNMSLAGVNPDQVD